MTRFPRGWGLTLALSLTAAWGQSPPREPHIGYLYPAGGPQGATLQVLAGGQSLRGATAVYISGEGVQATVVQHYRPLRNLSPEQRQALLSRLRQLLQKRLAEWPGPVARLLQSSLGPWSRGRQTEKPAATASLPEHPLLRNLEGKSLRELVHIANQFLNLRKRQPNAQIAETVLIDVSIAPDAPPGDRELRLGTPLGLTNPLRFQVGWLPERCEQEPNDPPSFSWLPREPPLDLPILLNGQIQPGDVDRFRFRAQGGQQLVIEVQARHLIPYLADAVPGWFQAVLTLYEARGREVAFADDYRFDPDPVLFYQVPETGVYELEVRDALYRGREDFVYRIAVGENPFITAMFPLGGRTGFPAMALIEGWNLPERLLPLDTRPGPDRLRQTCWSQGHRLSNQIRYAVDPWPEWTEEEPNDTPQSAAPLTPPLIVNGRIASPGDVDVFRFEGRAGEEVVAEVMARRLGSPLDSLLRLTDGGGQVLAWNDDHGDREGVLQRDLGLLTHAADSYLRVRLPREGTYFLSLADAQHHGGESYAYRLRLTPPQPDFELRVTPSSLNVRAGQTVPAWVHVLRKDGFEGPVELELKGAPPGFHLHGGRIPPGHGRVGVTLTAPPQPFAQPFSLQLEGHASIQGQTVRRQAVPCEDSMQAFLYRHLVPSQQLLVAVLTSRFRPPLWEPMTTDPLQVPANGTAQVQFRTGRFPVPGKLELELREAPPGVSLQGITVEPGRLTFQVKAEGDAAEVGFADNLIAEAFTEGPGGPLGPTSPRKQRVSLGVLPAIPFEIVAGNL